MPSKYPVLRPREIIKRLKTFGFYRVSQKGSHMKYSDGIHVVIIPNHDVVYKGTLQSILEQAGLSLETFLEG